MTNLISTAIIHTHTGAIRVHVYKKVICQKGKIKKRYEQGDFRSRTTNDQSTYE